MSILISRRGMKSVLFILFAVPVLAQQYVLSTFAGGLPPTPAAATSLSLYPPSSIAADAKGNVFLVSLNCIYKLSADGTLTRVAGGMRAGFSGDGGPATEGKLGFAGVNSGPDSGLAVDTAGNLYSAEFGNNRLRKILPNGIIVTVAGSGNYGLGGDGGPAVDDSLGQCPAAVAVDATGNIYLTFVGRIRKVSPDGIISTIAGGGSTPLADGALATSVQLSIPGGLAVDTAGNVFFSDRYSHRILKVTPAGVINFVAGTGTSGFSGDGGPATAAKLANPTGLAFDPVGNLYVVDADNYRVRKISTDGVITTIAGGGNTFPGNRVPATQAELYSPTAIAIDLLGNIFLAAGWVQKISPDGMISIVAGNGTYNFGGDGGPALSAQLWEPADIAIDLNGNVFIADEANHVVRRVDTKGIITTVAGTGAASYSGDGGPATKAAFRFPHGVAVDSAGNLYISDSENQCVRKVSASGIVTTIAGNGASTFAGDGGPATRASLNNPLGLAIDAKGNLFIADYENDRVRKVAQDGTITTVAGSGQRGFSGDGGPAT